MVSDEQIINCIRSIIEEKQKTNVFPNDFAKLYELLSRIRGELGLTDADEILEMRDYVRNRLFYELIKKRNLVTYGRTLNDAYFKLTEHANQQKEQEIP